MKVYSDNCGACGKEYLSSELMPTTKLGGTFSKVKVCSFCLVIADITEDYKSAAELIVCAFNPPDPQLQSPNVVIEPANSLIQKAVDLLKKVDPGYFSGVRKIVVSSSPDYGHVESGPNKDPAVINVNMARIQNEGQGSEKDIVRALATTIAHERGHVKSFDANLGFQGGEGPAVAEEQRIATLINNLPEYKS